MSDPVPDEINEAVQDETCRRANAIRKVLKRRNGSGTIAEVAELAVEKTQAGKAGDEAAVRT